MSKVAWVIGLASTLSFPAFAEDQMLEGTYRLVSSTRKLLESGQVVDTFGKHPTGYINYHLAIALCRCMNIPARYCTGYLGDSGVPADINPMDFSAWAEVFLDGQTTVQ